MQKRLSHFNENIFDKEDDKWTIIKKILLQCPEIQIGNDIWMNTIGKSRRKTKMNRNL